MSEKTIAKALRGIGLALNACHNTVTTDDPDAKPDEVSWRIDNSKEIALVAELEATLVSSNDSDPGYAGHNSDPSS